MLRHNAQIKCSNRQMSIFILSFIDRYYFVNFSGISKQKSVNLFGKPIFFKFEVQEATKTLKIQVRNQIPSFLNEDLKIKQYSSEEISKKGTQNDQIMNS